MELRRYKYFIQVAELGSLSRAADQLRIAQPALSRQMRLLEEELGVALFVRSTRGMQLTEAGEELRAHLIGPLRQLKFALQSVRSQPTSDRANVVLGLPPSLTMVLARPMVDRVARDAPNLALRIVEGRTAHLFEWLLNGSLDMAVLYGQQIDDRILTRDVLIEELSLIGPPDVATLSKEAATFRQVSELPLILPGRGSSLRDVVERCAAKTKTLLDIRLEIDSLQATKAFVESGFGYSILPSYAVRVEQAEGRLTATPVSSPCITRQLVLASRAECQKPRAIMQLDKIILDEITRLVDAGIWSAQLIGATVR